MTPPCPSHLQGLFARTIRMVENDLKPCYVFDGKPPALKSNVVRPWFLLDKESRITHPPVFWDAAQEAFRWEGGREGGRGGGQGDGRVVLQALDAFHAGADSGNV